jgi:hypothetical protein
METVSVLQSGFVCVEEEQNLKTKMAAFPKAPGGQGIFSHPYPTTPVWYGQCFSSTSAAV